MKSPNQRKLKQSPDLQKHLSDLAAFAMPVNREQMLNSINTSLDNAQKVMQDTLNKSTQLLEESQQQFQKSRENVATMAEENAASGINNNQDEDASIEHDTQARQEETLEQIEQASQLLMQKTLKKAEQAAQQHLTALQQQLQDQQEHFEQLMKQHEPQGSEQEKPQDE